MNENTNVVPLPEPDDKKALLPAPFDFAPKSLSEAMQLSELLAKSTLVPKDYIDKPGNVLVAIQMGGELGLKPMQSMQNIAVINGRPSVWGDALLALVRSATAPGPDGKPVKILDGIVESFDSATQTASCTVKRRGFPEHTQTFSMKDAVKADLANKPIWKQYPERMLKMRARAFALRDVFTDVLKGMPVAEEVMDYAPPEKDVTPAKAPGDDAAHASSRSDKVLAERAAAKVKAICDSFDSARNDAELGLAVEKAKALPEGPGREQALEHYRKAKARLIPAGPQTTEPAAEAKAATEAKAADPVAQEGHQVITAAEVSKAIALAKSKDDADAAADLIRFVEGAEAQAELRADYEKKVATFGETK